VAALPNSGHGQSKEKRTTHGMVQLHTRIVRAAPIGFGFQHPHAHQQGSTGEDDTLDIVNDTGVIPEGLPAAVLPSNSPAPQILLRDKNRIQYANKAAIHLLGSTRNHNLVNREVDDNIQEGRDMLGPVPPPRLQKRTSTEMKAKKRRTKGIAIGSQLVDIDEDATEPQEHTVYSLEGLALKELPMGLDEETCWWIL